MVFSGEHLQSLSLLLKFELKSYLVLKDLLHLLFHLLVLHELPITLFLRLECCIPGSLTFFELLLHFGDTQVEELLLALLLLSLCLEFCH